MCLICQTKVDPAELDAFGAQFLGTLNQAAAAMMISIGNRTGLFETMRHLPASTSSEIASAAGLNERYVREWLGAMTTSGITTCDETGQRFQLLPAARAMLTDEPGSENLAFFAQYISVLGRVEDQVVDCFHRGGGVPYSEYPRFHEVMAMDSGQSVVGAMFEHIVPLVPGLDLALQNGIRVLDIGCGRGRALRQLAACFPESRFYGYDLSEEAIAFARHEAAGAGLSNVTFEVRDLSDFDASAPVAIFDLITAFDAIHDQARPDRVLRGIRRALRPDGVFLMQDIAGSSNVAENLKHPIGSLLYTVSCMHCMTVSLAQGGLGVGAMWGEQMATRFVEDAGFASVQRHALAHDIQNYYYVARP